MLLKLITLAVAWACIAQGAEVELITKPRPGEEYVLVQGGQAQPVKQPSDKERLFETAHKIPEKLPTHHVTREEEDSRPAQKLDKAEFSPVLDALLTGHVASTANVKRESGEGIIEIGEEKKLLKKESKKKASEASRKHDIEIDIPLSKIETVKISEEPVDVQTNPEMQVELAPMSEVGKIEATSQRPVLTTGAPSTPRSFEVLPVNLGSADINSGLLAASSDSNVPLEVAGSEQKQHSRIQIKKGPNGQDYEYEYVYYYYDDEEEGKKNETTEKKPAEVPAVHNSHDGPQSGADKASRSKNRYSSIERGSTATTTSTTAAPENNEVVPANSRGRYRGRNLPQASQEADVSEERSRNPNTTPSNSEKTDAGNAEKHTRQKGKPHQDSHAEESTGQSRNRSRANVRRPSLELVDSASFNTHASDVSVSQYKEIRSRINSAEEKELERAQSPAAAEPPASPAATKERPSEAKAAESVSEAADADKPVSEASEDSATEEGAEFTTMTAMDKVALDLYAILASENLKNDISAAQDEDEETTTTDSGDDMTTTEMLTTTEEATTTTSTTTTEAPTTTSTAAPAPSSTVRGSRFRQRGGAKPRVPAPSEPAAAPAPAAQPPSKPRGRYGNSRPAFGRGKATGTSAAPPTSEERVTKQESAPAQSQKPSLSRSRFGSRSRPTLTASTAAPAGDAPPSTEAPPATRSRLRPGLSLRGRRPLPGASTSAPAEPAPVEEQPEGPADEPTSTAKSFLGRGRVGGNVRPLRPGPRLNIGGARTTAAPVSTEALPASSAEPKDASSEQSEATTQQTGEVTVGNPLTRLRGRPRLQVQAAAKPRAAAPVVARRPSPLVGRRRQPDQESSESTSSTESATEQAEAGESEEAAGEAEAGEAAEETPTEAPRSLSALLAGRRRAPPLRRPGTIL